MTKRLFIVFEGLDGSGLSTQAKLLYKHLSKKNLVLLTKEPSNSTVGKLIRTELKKSHVNHRWLQLLYVTDRKEHVSKVILPALNHEKIVICDRYVLSSLAFGSIKTKLDYLKKLNSSFPKPDITLLLKVPAKICVKRIKKTRGSFELFEHEKTLKNVWYTYQELAKKDKTIVIIDGARSKKEVFKTVKEVLGKTFDYL